MPVKGNIDGGIMGYSHSSNLFPKPLEAEEEAEYIELLYNGDEKQKEDARNILIEHNLRLVAHIAKKYASASIPADDLISVGTIGLIKAISTFRAEKGNRLGTYAVRCIENAILSQRRFQVCMRKTMLHPTKHGACFAA